MKKDNYLNIDEKDNGIDYLIQSLVFLSQIEQNKIFIKWFIIAFHGALYSFMILVLQGINQDLIYEKLPKYRTNNKGQLDNKSKIKITFDPLDGKLLKFLDAFSKIKDNTIMGNYASFSPTKNIDLCMQELNSKLRNQFMHFVPVFWASEPWYPASVCLPLLSLFNYCISFEKNGLDSNERKVAKAYVGSIKTLLEKYSNDD